MMKRKEKANFCRDSAGLLISYSQNTLSLEDAECIERHLQNCHRCRDELSLLQELRRLEQVEKRGAIDPETIVHALEPITYDVDQRVPTVNSVIHDIASVESSPDLSEHEKTRHAVEIMYRFLVQTQTFLQGQYAGKTGNQWIKLEKKRATLLQKILADKRVSHLKPVMRLQAEAFVSRGIIFQLHGDTGNAETNLSLSIVVHWALGSFKTMETHRFLGEIKFYQGDIDSAEYLFAQALQSPDINAREQTLLLRNLGNIYYVRGDLSACQHYLEQAAAISESLDSPDYTAQDFLNLSVIDFHQGNLSLAQSQCEKALALLTKSSNTHLKGRLHSNLATFMTVQGLFENARSHYKCALHFFQKGHYTHESVHVLRNNALAEYEFGCRTKADDLLKTAREMYSDTDSLTCQMDILASRLERQAGEYTKARNHLDNAISLASALDEHLLLDAALLECAFVALAEKRFEDLKQILSKTSAMKKKRSLASPSIFDLENEASLVEAFAALGNSAAAARCIRRLKRMVSLYKKNRDKPCLHDIRNFSKIWSHITMRLQERLFL
jgi:tetratricopeptide (TPR) repeat protein